MNHPAALIASALISSSPILVIGVVGAVLSHIRLRQTHARARLLAVSGFGLLAAQALLGAGVRAYLDMMVISGSMLPVAVGNHRTITGVVSYLLLAASLILLLLAVLADRDSSGTSRGAIQQLPTEVPDKK